MAFSSQALTANLLHIFCSNTAKALAVALQNSCSGTASMLQRALQKRCTGFAVSIWYL